MKADRSQKNVDGRDTGQESISDRVMRPALSEQCPKGAANLVPLAAAPERKRVTLDPVRCHGPSQPSVSHPAGARMFHQSQCLTAT